MAAARLKARNNGRAASFRNTGPEMAADSTEARGENKNNSMTAGETMDRWKLGTCMWGMPEKGISGAIKAAEIGFEGISMDVSMFESADAGEERDMIQAWEQVKKDHGIVCPSVSVEILNDYGLTKPVNSDTGKFALEASCRGIETAEKLGVSVIQLPSFNDGAIRTEEDFRRTCEKMRILCREAEGTDVHIASENNLDLPLTLRMIEEVGSDRFGILFDTQNYYLNGIGNTSELFREIAPYVYQIHVKDGVKGTVSNALIGEGESGFEDIAEAIREAYQGEWILIETYYDRPPFDTAGGIYELVNKDMETCRTSFPLLKKGETYVSSGI